MLSVQLVPLPPIWRPLLQEAWSLSSALGSPDFRRVARRTQAVTRAADGSLESHDVTCLASHGLERKTPYPLFLEEIRARGWLRSAADAASTPPRRGERVLWLVPVVGVPPSYNASVRAAMAAGLFQAVRNSVATNPPPPGSSGPNHFMLVARVCSCYVRHDRRPHLGRRARDECAPFPRVGRLKDLSYAVRVVSWEQVTPLDRHWSKDPAVRPRLPNVVMPYPSSFLGRDVSGGGSGHPRPAPWELERLHKPILVFSAMGRLTKLPTLRNFSRPFTEEDRAATNPRRLSLSALATPTERSTAGGGNVPNASVGEVLRAAFQRACSSAERRLIGSSSCYGTDGGHFTF